MFSKRGLKMNTKLVVSIPKPPRHPSGIEMDFNLLWNLQDVYNF
jgi:hypothetical protein